MLRMYTTIFLLAGWFAIALAQQPIGENPPPTGSDTEKANEEKPGTGTANQEEEDAPDEREAEQSAEEPEPSTPPEHEYEPPAMENRAPPPVPDPPRRRRTRRGISPNKNPVVNELMKNRAQERAAENLKKKFAINKSAATEKMKLEVVDESLANVFRMISKTYKINIVPDPELGDMKTTIHLEDISVWDGLKVICRSNNLEMNEIQGVIYIKKASDKAIAEMNLYRKKIDIKVENKPVKDFIREFSQKTGISIVPEQELEGKVSGHLNNVLPVNGFKALMKANGYRVSQRSGIYMVSHDEEEEGGRRGTRRRFRNTGSSNFDINIVDGKISITAQGANLGQVIQAISNQEERDVIVYGELNDIINVNIKDVPIDKALALLLKGSKFTFIIRDGMILIGDSKGSALSSVAIHPLKYIRADANVLKLFPKSIATDEIKVVEEQNAILISGTAENIQLVKEFLETIDVPVPQVSIEVMIVEYERSNSSELGVATGPTPTGVPSVAGRFNMSGGKESFTVGPFTGAVSILPQDWNLYLRSALEKIKGKVLAMPKITTLNGNKAHLRVRSTSYFPVTSFNQEGLPSTDFRTIDDGITIDLTPWVTQHGDINLEIKPSIKTTQPGSNSGENVPNPVTDRAITSNVRLRDGETLILGGLIDSKESNTRTFVPILGHIPLLGYLFSWRQKSTSTTELVLYVTPHILDDSLEGVDLLQELKELDKRGGFLKDKHFLGTNGKADEKESPSKKKDPVKKQEAKTKN